MSVLRVEAFLIRGAFFTAMAGLDLDFIVGAFMALRAGVLLDFRVALGVAAFNFLIGVFFVSDLEVAFFLLSALALLLEAGDFGAAMVFVVLTWLGLGRYCDESLFVVYYFSATRNLYLCQLCSDFSHDDNND